MVNRSTKCSSPKKSPHCHPNVYPYIHLDNDDEYKSGHDEGGEMNSDVTVAYSMDECEDSDAASGQDSAPLPALLKELHFWYIDPDGRVVSSKDQAAVTINGELNIDVEVNCHIFISPYYFPTPTL